MVIGHNHSVDTTSPTVACFQFLKCHFKSLILSCFRYKGSAQRETV